MLEKDRIFLNDDLVLLHQNIMEKCMPEFQILGIPKCSDTRKAQRFFQDRKIKFHFRDLNEKGVSRGEYESISSKIPVGELIDRTGKRFKEKQLEYMVFTIEDELLNDALLFRTPIVRYGKEATVGYQPDIWKKWIAENI